MRVDGTRGEVSWGGMTGISIPHRQPGSLFLTLLLVWRLEASVLTAMARLGRPGHSKCSPVSPHVAEPGRYLVWLCTPKI